MSLNLRLSTFSNNRYECLRQMATVKMLSAFCQDCSSFGRQFYRKAPLALHSVRPTIADQHGLSQDMRLHRELQENLAESLAVLEESGRLNIRAEFAGIWLDVDPLIKKGVWLNTHDNVGLLVDPDTWIIDAYVEQRLVPSQALYRVRLQLADPPEALQETRGRVRIAGARKSLLINGAKNFISVLVRESGF